MALLLQDLRYALRLLLRQPAFTAIVVVTLALGIGANTAIFSVVNGVLWKPMPYADPDRLVHVHERDPNDRPNAYRLVSIPNFEDWREKNRLFEDMARLQPYQGPFYLTWEVGGQPLEILSYPMTGALFRLLAVQPILGRTFTPEEELPGNDRVVVLSYPFWRRHLQGDRGMIGKQITLSSRGYTVIGVMPEGFEFPPFEQPLADKREVWLPAQTDPATVNDRDWRGEYIYGRLKPGVTVEEATAELNAICQQLGEIYPETNKGWTSFIMPMHSRFVNRTRERPLLLFLLGAVGFVLLIGCANVANLLMARAASRQRELAVRAALGAGRRRIARQLVTESLLAALLGGGLGLLLAYGGLEGFRGYIPKTMPRVDDMTVDHRVLLFTLAVTVLTGLLFGTAPALRAAGANLFGALKQERTTRGFHRNYSGNALIILEVALSLVLLIGAGLMLKSFARMLGDDYGFQAEHVLTVRTLLPEDKYGQPGQARRFHDELYRRVETLPGVETLGLVSTLPLHSSQYSTRTRFTIEGAPEMDYREWPLAHYKVIGPGFFGTMRIPLAMGRDLSPRDDQGAPLVMVLGESMARQYWPQENPIGKRIKIRWPGGKVEAWRTVVGVVRDIKLNLTDGFDPIFYVPYGQMRESTDLSFDTYFLNMRWSNLVVRTATDPASLAAAAQDQVWAIDKDQPVEVHPMTTVIAETLAPKHFSTLLTVVFSVLALVLASAGIYGVISYSVAGRTQEIGLRMAMGAQPGDVVRMVVRQGLWLTLAGVSIGLAAAFGLSRYVTSQLYEVSPTDAATYAVVSVLLTAVALLACYVPARRAAKVDPLVALRHE